MDPRPSPDRTYRLCLWLALFSIPASTLSWPLAEYDTGWHLRTGWWILEHGTVPRTDPFTTLPEGTPWIAYNWLFDLALVGVWETGGLAGLVGMRTAMGFGVCLTLFGLIRRREGRPAHQALLAGAAYVALYPLLVAERPGLLSIVFLIWTMEGVLLLRAGRLSPWLAALPLVYPVWANVHIQFVHGLSVLGLGWASFAVDAVAARIDPAGATSPSGKGWWTLTLVGAACFAATFVNPYGWRIYETVLEYAQLKEMYRLFAELQAPEFRQIADWVLLGLTLAAAFALGRWRRGDSFQWLLLAAGCYFSFHARHDLWFAVLAACVILSSTGPPPETPPHFLQRNGIVLLGAAAAIAFRLLVSSLSEERLRNALIREFPVQAAAFLEADPPAALYNPIDWGGFLEWKLPRTRIAIDGRAQLHGDDRLRRFIHAWKGLPGWSSDADLLEAKAVLLQRNAPLAELLRLDPRFRLVYEDEVAVVFGKR